MEEPTILALLPPALTIVMAVVTRNVILSLGIGVAVGMGIHEGYNPLAGLVSLFEKGLFAQLTKGSNAQIVILICVIGGFVRQLDNSGGMRAFAALITKRVSTPTRAQLAVLLSGVAIFFTDSGNSLILGPLFRPIFDKLRLCREKLAFVIDATSSPVCVLVPFIGWGVYIMSLIEQGYEQTGQPVNALQVLVGVLPYQFYPLLALCSVVLFALAGREFGPMRRAQEGLQSAPRLEPEAPAPASEPVGGEAGASVIVLPLVTVFATIGGLFLYYFLTTGGLPGAKVRTTLVLAYLCGAVVCALVLRRQTGTELAASWKTFMQGMQGMFSIAIVLLLAWSLGVVCGLLDTSGYVAGLLGGSVPGWALPPIIFAMGAVISLSTGSSYGTFAILMPIAIPLAAQLDAPMAVTIAAVLSGGVLGDHASPISDTTILSSMATGCAHADHVNTQLPYALMTGSAALVSFVLAGWTGSALSIGLGLLLLAGLVFGLTRLGSASEA